MRAFAASYKRLLFLVVHQSQNAILFYQSHAVYGVVNAWLSKGRFNVLSNCKPVETGSYPLATSPRRERRGYAKPSDDEGKPRQYKLIHYPGFCERRGGFNEGSLRSLDGHRSCRMES